MRLHVFFLLLALAPGCARVHERAGEGGVELTGEFTAMADDSQLTTCTCHHGCGPGLDGVFTFTLTNATAMSHAFTVTRVTVAAPSGRYATPDHGSFRVMGAAADGAITLAPGTTAPLVVTVTLDTPAVEPGTDSVTVDAMLDGNIVMFELATVLVTTAPGC